MDEKDKKVETVKEVINIFEKAWSKQVILYGPPGTGKTYSATEIAAIFLAKCADRTKAKKGGVNFESEEEKLKIEGKISHEKCEDYLKDNENYKVIQFHPSYSYEDFVRGIVVKTSDGNGKPLSVPSYKVERKIIETFGEGTSEDSPRVLVIDEINRAPLGSVLGELIYGLEYRGKAVSTPYTYSENNVEIPLKISEHLYIIGTMNTADRSIGTMDYAVRRRFAFVPVPSCPDIIKNTWKSSTVGETAERLFNKLMHEKQGIFSKAYLEDTELDVNDIKIGHTYFLGNSKVSKDEELDYLKYRVKYQIKPVYQEYIKDGLIKREGMDRFKEIEKEIFNSDNSDNNVKED